MTGTRDELIQKIEGALIDASEAGDSRKLQAATDLLGKIRASEAEEQRKLAATIKPAGDP